MYGTPAESLCYRFAKIDKKKFGEIKDVTDKGYYTNSYHVDVREKIDAVSKLAFESQFQKISSGGCISYVEVPNMQKNLPALETLVRFIYDNIMYAEFNTKSDYCHECGFDGEIKIVTDEDTFVVDLTDAQDTEVFIHAMSKYVNGKINPLDKLEQYMLRGLRDTTKSKKIVFFLKDFVSYCRNEGKYYDDVPIRVCLNFIKYCICYWFYESTPIPESWKKKFTLYVTEDW